MTARPEGDGGAHTQLDLYAVAAVDTWGVDPAQLRTTYCWLQVDGPPVLDVTDWDAGRVAAARADLDTSLEGLAHDRYDATPGPWCERCEFLDFCKPGRLYVR